VHLRVVEVAQQQQHGIGAELTELLELGSLGEEALGEQRHATGRSRGGEIGRGPAEALVDQDRDRGRARALEARGQGGRIRVGS
jgi:hypothetical protein